MAGGSKKKKKPVSNPARGFATTSIQSIKAKLEEANGASQTSKPQEGRETDISIAETTSVDHAIDKSGAHTSKDALELTPEEFEAQLELSELQQIVEKYAAKTRKESTRQSSRLETDKRLFRGQADYLIIKDWLPDDLLAEILTTAEAELAQQHAAEQRTQGLQEDIAIARLWALQQILEDLAIPDDRIQEVLAYLIRHPPVNDNVTSTWGLSTALDWMALNCVEMPGYEVQKVGQANGPTPSVEDDGQCEESSVVVTQAANPQRQDRTEVEDEIDESIPDVSDIDSDAEPEELLETYIRTRTILHNITVSQADLKQPKPSKRNTDPNLSGKGVGSYGRKLQDKIQLLEKDVLFDQREADARWNIRKIELLKEAAIRKRLELPSLDDESVNDEAQRLADDVLKESDEAADDMLGGIFDALPGVLDQPSTSDGTHNNSGLEIRDFGRLSGMNPKRVLEEACRARDNQVKITYRLVSPTTFASRHAVTVHWSRDQPEIRPDFLPMIEYKANLRLAKITSLRIATPDTAQSEAYVATVALFVIFSGSPKEEKAHMRLPPSYRDLWAELLDLQLESAAARDRNAVKSLRNLLEEHRVQEEQADDEEDEQVVFNGNVRRRFDGSGAATPLKHVTNGVSGSEPKDGELQEMWRRKTATPSYQNMLETRMRLPMFQFKEIVLDVVARHQVTILCGETGCGKSTQLPAFVLEQALANGVACKIYCTEPRRISAISLAQRVSEELGERPGDIGTVRSLVGYAIRLESHTSAETRLVYATVGIVLRMLERADGLSDVTHLIVDEVHERSIDTDFLLIVLRSLLVKRPDLKVILMSATVDAQKFSNYLNGAPIVTVPGRTFPVQTRFLEDAVELTGHTIESDGNRSTEQEDEFDVEATTKGLVQLPESYSRTTRATMATYDEYRIDYGLIVKLIQKVAFDPGLQQFSSATLVFLPGIAEIRQLNDMLTSMPAFARGWRIFPLHSSFASEDQQAAFHILPHGVRKIVLATNIAETGITIPDVTCVIDTGKHKEMRFDERRQISKLVLSFVAKANAKQRRGRAGRVQEGICFHLFTKHRHDELMAEQQTPEMLRLSLQDLAMRVKVCKLGDIEHALTQALDPPSAKNIRRAIDALIEVDALTPSEELTSLGLQIAKLPLDAQLGKFVLLSSIFKCLDFGLTAAAALTSKSPFLTPLHAKNKADTIRLGFKRGDSDLLTLYNAYCTWRKVCQTPGMSEFHFCNKNYLSQQNLANIEDLKAQLLSSLVDSGFVSLDAATKQLLAKIRPGSRQRNFVALPTEYTAADEDDAVCSAVLAWSFYPKIIKQDGKGWKNVANNQSLALHPTSVNKHNLAPYVKMLSFYSIMQSNSRFTNAQETTPASDVALVILAGDAVFHMYAGVIVIDGNRMRFKVGEWRIMLALKMLRVRVKEALSRALRYPGRELSGKNQLWLDILNRMFAAQRRARVA